MKRIAPLLAALSISSPVISQPCHCPEAFNFMVEKIEVNYSGFKDKVNVQNRTYYKSFTDSLRNVASAASNQQQDSCFKILKHWIGFLKDGHVSVGIGSVPGININPDSIRLKFRDWPKVNHTSTTFSEYLKKNKKSLKPLEGIWQDPDLLYKIGIIYQDKKYKAFILKADSIYWVPGQVKFEMKENGKDFTGPFYIRDHTKEDAVYNVQTLANGFIEISNRGKWYKVNDDKASNYYPGFNIVNFQQLSATTNIITIKSFNENYRKLIDSIITANDALIRKTPNLIIDVRGNGGGSDISYYPLRKYLFTHPYLRYGTDILCTNDNIQKFRELAINPVFTKAEQDDFRKRVADMEKHLNEYWSAWQTTFMSDTLEVLSYPKKIAVLMDKGCGSTTEQFLIDPASNSKKTTLYGQPSAGVLDYANLYYFNIPNTNFRVNYATSRSKRVDMGKGIDNIGIQPHMVLDDSVKDWVKHVQQQLEKK